MTRELTKEQWEQEGTEKFGPDQMKWRFVCPCCGHVATPQDWKDAGAKETAVAYSCVGRWAGAKREAFGKGEGPCNYAGGGLIGLNPLKVEGHQIFEFAAIEDDKENAINE